jgi:hypothetical protein
MGSLGNDRYETLFEKNEIVELVDYEGPFPLVRRRGTREIPRMVSMRQLKEYSEK